MKFVIDMSSILWAHLLAGKDEDAGVQVEFEGRSWQINSAYYGYESFMIMMRNLFAADPTTAPYKCIMVKDGVDSRSFRQKIYAEYKGKRKPKPPEAIVEFNVAMEMIEKTMLNLGAQTAVQHGMEADDLVAYFATKLEGPITVLSNDGDMLALVSDNVSVRNTKGELNPEKYAPCPFEFTDIYKSLVGDTSDNIPGAKGFGDKAFIELYIKYAEEGLADIRNLILEKRLHDLEGEVSDFKPFQKLITGAEGVYSSYACAIFHLDAVDTLNDPIEWTIGKVNCWVEGESEALLEEFYQEVHLVHAGNYAEMLGDARALIAGSDFVSLDYETSTPPESDAWVKANTPKNGRAPVDVFGSELTGMGLTFGRNQQFTLYFTVDHVETDEHKNVESEQIRQFLLMIAKDTPIAVHNSSFELAVGYNAWADKQEDNGYHGFLPNVHDTMHLAAYVDENLSHGLKFCSKNYLGYEQVSYDEVTGGKKMNELTAQHVLAYGADDTMCTSALYSHFQTICQCEGSWGTYLDLEPAVAYLCALAFIRGINIDAVTLEELRKEDQQQYDTCWEIVRDYLIKIGWEGTQYQSFEPTTAGIKYAFQIVAGKKLKSQKRKIETLCDDVRAQGAPVLADWIGSEDWPAVDSYVKELFSPEPDFNIDSPKQYCKLLFEAMALPIHLRNPPTDKMREKARAAGVTAVGSPKSDALAVIYALTYDVKEGDKREEVLKAVSKMKQCNTRAKLYYRPYAALPHWKDGKVHPQFGQNMTNTRRFAPNKPNLAQLPKQGDGLKVRRIITPHTDNAFILALDESGQEMRLIGDYSEDESLCACFVGENKKDVHSLTGLGIAQRKGHPDISYEEFIERLDSEEKEFTDLRKLGKKCNFTVEFGARAPKLAQTMMITEEEAALYIEAKYSQFARVEEWKSEVIAEARRLGYTTTKLGVRRHLREAYTSEDKWLKMKSDRRAVNVKIQGSACEQIKQVLRDIWNNDICFSYNCNFLMPVHDEVVLSVCGGDLMEVTKSVHGYMVQPYGDMTIPIVSSYGIGPNFGEQKELGEVYDHTKVFKIAMGCEPEGGRV